MFFLIFYIVEEDQRLDGLRLRCADLPGNREREKATGRPKFISEAESFTPMKREKRLRVSAGIKGFFEVAGSLDLFGAVQRALSILAQLRYENTLENKFLRFYRSHMRPPRVPKH